MNSDYDITLHSEEASAPGNARERFLDSFGLGEIPAATPLVTPQVEVENYADDSVDEGVVLSSMPDDLEMPAVESEAGQRTVSNSPASSSERTRTVAISITPKESAAVKTETETEFVSEKAEPTPDKNTNPDENLTLACPECHGELVLQRRHLGIEGLCVWCHTPIIAAESARDSIVRVFPVLGRITKPFAAPAPAPAPVVVEEPAPVAAVVEEKVAVAEPVAKAETPAPAPETLSEAPVVEEAKPIEIPAEVVATAPEEEIETPAPEPASFSPESFGFGPPSVTPAVSMTSLPAAKTDEADSAAAKEEVSPFDLDALYATSSFRQIAPQESMPETVGFGESLAGTAPAGSSDEEALANGFGAFLQSSPSENPAPVAAPLAAPAAAAPQEAAGFSAATPWGPPSKPAIEATAPLAPATSMTPATANDDAPVALPTDFASGFGSPALPPASPAPSAENDDAGFTAAPWATAFEAAAPAAGTATPSPVDDFAAAFSTAGFGSVDAVSDLGSFTAPGEANPAFAPAPLSNDFASGFQATGFGTPAPAPAPAAAIEPASLPQESAIDDFAAAFASAGFVSPAPAPATASPDPISAESGFASFTNAAPAASPTIPAADAVETPEFTFHNSPSAKLLFGGEATDEKRSFAMPGHGFSTGSSSESDDKAPLFPDSSTTGASTTGWGISEPIGFSSPDDAPVPLSSGPASVPDAVPVEESPFGKSPFPSVADTLPGASVETPMPLFSEALPAMTSPTPAAPPAATAAPEIPAAPVTPPPIPALPQVQEPTFSSIANPIEASAPNVVSEPLGSKPKPKVRKGFIVLMVVIVGFAAGAALASFVLPIDEYVQTARTLMEEKFNPGSAIQQLPALPVEAGDASVAPVTEP